MLYPRKLGIHINFLLTKIRIASKTLGDAGALLWEDISAVQKYSKLLMMFIMFADIVVRLLTGSPSARSTWGVGVLVS